MPTGYTQPVVDGKITTLRAFAERCAGAFLHCVRNSDKLELPESVPIDPYYANKIAAWDEKLRVLRSMTITDTEVAYVEAKMEHLHTVDVWEAESRVERTRYVTMLAFVRVWNAPAAYIPLKEFMIQQLVDSMKTCVDDMRYEKRRLDFPPTAIDWYKLELSLLEEQLTHFHNEHAKQVTFATRETEYIRGLRACFEGEQ